MHIYSLLLATSFNPAVVPLVDLFSTPSILVSMVTLLTVVIISITASLVIFTHRYSGYEFVSTTLIFIVTIVASISIVIVTLGL